jgi:hypothetical protein
MSPKTPRKVDFFIKITYGAAMPIDNRIDPFGVAIQILHPVFAYPENADFDRWMIRTFGAYDPDPAPWQSWDALKIGTNPDLPLDLQDKKSSVHTLRERWANAVPKFSLTDLFTRAFYALQKNPHYTVVGGTYGLPGGEGWRIAARLPGHPVVSDFEAVRRWIIEDEYGASSFANGRVLDPRLRDLAAKETNIWITGEAARELASGRDYVMLWPAQALYPEQISAFRQLAAGKGRTLTCNLIAGTQDIRKTLKAAYDHGVKTGEWMHPRQIAGTLKAFAANFKATAAAADTVELWNTDGAKPLLIARKTGPGEALEILDPSRYHDFEEQQYFNPAGRKLTEISPRLALHKLFSPQLSPDL